MELGSSHYNPPESLNRFITSKVLIMLQEILTASIIIITVSMFTYYVGLFVYGAVQLFNATSLDQPTDHLSSDDSSKELPETTEEVLTVSKPIAYSHSTIAPVAELQVIVDDLTEDLEYSMEELRTIAKGLKIKGYNLPNMKKDTLIRKIREAGGNL